MRRSAATLKSQTALRLKDLLSSTSLPVSHRSPDHSIISGFRSDILEPVTHKKNFAIYPHEPLVQLLGRPLSNEDVVANLMFRASEIFEAADNSTRRALLTQYQSEIFVAMNDAFREGNPAAYTIFSVFDSGKLRSVSPALRPKRRAFLTDFAFQPILRFIFARPENKLDPNLILAAMGPRAFLQFRDAFFLEIFLLSAKSVDICMRSLEGEKGIFHDAVRFAFSFFPEKIETPLVPGSQWNLQKIFEKICERKSPEMLRHFYGFSSPQIKSEILKLANSRNPVTGLLNLPWAHHLLADMPLLPDMEYTTPSPAQLPASSEDVEDYHVTEIREFGGPLDRDQIFLLDAPENISWLFKTLEKSQLIAINFRKSQDSGDLPELFSFAIPGSAFIVDLAALRTQRAFSYHAAVGFIFDFIFRASEIKKVTINCEGLFDAVAAFRARRPRDFFGEENQQEFFYFENVTDLRRPRIKRVRKFRAVSEPTDIDSRMGEAMSFKDLSEISKGAEKFPDEVKETEEIEMLQGYQPLSKLTERFLGFSLAQNLRDFAVRPLPLAAVAAAGREVHAMVQLEQCFEAQGYQGEIFNATKF